MNFLNNYGFENNHIETIEKNTPSILKDELVKNEALIGQNVDYLKNNGISNYREVFAKYPEMFLMDANLFEGVFTKYDREDTIEKIAKNIAIVEYL